MKQKHYSRKIKAMGEEYSLAAYEYVYFDTHTRSGSIRNHVNDTPIKVLQGGVYVTELRFTEGEVISQFGQ